MSGSDVLASGAGRPPVRRGALAVAALIALVAFGGWRLSHRSEATRSALDDRQTSPPLEPDTTAGASPSAAAFDRRLPMGGSTEARLLLVGDRSFDLTVDEGRAIPAAVPPGAKRALPIRAGFVVRTQGSADSGSVWFIDATGRSRPESIGGAAEIIAAAADDSVWMASGPDGAGVLRRYDLITHLVAETVELGRNRRAIRETPNGFVTLLDNGSSTSLELFDTTTHRVTRTYLVAAGIAVRATSSRHVAFTLSQCDGSDCLQLTELATGAKRNLDLPPVWTTDSAEFAPDGRSLAILGRAGNGVDGERELLVADVATGTVEVVTGVRRGESLTRITWTQDSQWFFATRRSFDVLLGYRVGDTLVRYAPRPELFGATGPFSQLAAY